jgi:myo-inositol 2-dehydrogenase/D-chiro-inositol 1-dehydrogenase
MNKTIKVGLIGAGFVSDLHAYAFKHFVKDAEIVAVAALEKADEFAKEHGIPNAFDDYHEMLKMKDVDVVTVAIPNYVHRQATVDAAKAGKHVICEKPLCVTLEEADEMIDTCKKQGVLLMYAEELLFAPKYVRAKMLIEEGAIGEPFLAKQSEEHPGPHMPVGCWESQRSKV